MHALSFFFFGGGGGVSLCFKYFPTSIILFLVFSFSFLYVLVAFICFQFLGNFLFYFDMMPMMNIY